MRKTLQLLIFILVLSSSKAQSQQALKLSTEQIEAMFLQQNLQLVAEQMNVDIADADIAQAKLWENPELSIGDINLWDSKSQREEAEMGSFPRNAQFSIELSQLIQTANKRGKLIRKEKVSKEIAIQDFEEVLRGMKVELRKSINEIIYLQSYRDVLSGQETYLIQLIDAYKKQVSMGNIAKNELLRLQSSSLELESEINETQTSLNEQQKNIKALLNLEPLVDLEVQSSNPIIIDPNTLLLPNLLNLAANSRPDIKRQKLETKLHEKTLDYEKSLRVPDLTFSASYDRYGGVWKDFVGIGVSFNLPFFNRNQGGIKAAKLSKSQSQYLEQQQVNIVQHEVVEAYGNYVQAHTFYKKISNNELLTELDNMLEVYTKNLLNKNISMLEYLDFMESYKTSKQTVLTARQNIDTLFQELQYATGTEIK